jgi:hypothetical protein
MAQTSPYVMNLREWTPTPSQAKEDDETSLLDTVAHETPDTVQAKNTNTEDTNATPAFGKLGAQGRS